MQHAFIVSMIALGGPKLKPLGEELTADIRAVSMIALGGPKLKLLSARAETLRTCRRAGSSPQSQLAFPRR